jgi:hypothetical protein
MNYVLVFAYTLLVFGCGYRVGRLVFLTAINDFISRLAPTQREEILAAMRKYLDNFEQ